MYSLYRQTLEQEKKRNLDKTAHKTSHMHDHAPGWNEHLASASEAHVKADKSDNSDPNTLVSKTIEHVKKRHHADDNTVGVEAEYEREEVSGPLGGTQKKGPGM